MLYVILMDRASLLVFFILAVECGREDQWAFTGLINPNCGQQQLERTSLQKRTVQLLYIIHWHIDLRLWVTYRTDWRIIIRQVKTQFFIRWWFAGKAVNFEFSSWKNELFNYPNLFNCCGISSGPRWWRGAKRPRSCLSEACLMLYLQQAPFYCVDGCKWFRIQHCAYGGYYYCCV